MKVYLHHGPDPERLTEVRREMKNLGAPSVRVFEARGVYFSIEGVHRLTVAHEFGLKPEFRVIGEDLWDAQMDEVHPSEEGLPGMEDFTVREFLEGHIEHVRENNCPALVFPDDCPCHRVRIQEDVK